MLPIILLKIVWLIECLTYIMFELGEKVKLVWDTER